MLLLAKKPGLDGLVDVLSVYLGFKLVKRHLRSIKQDE